jgi:hypothetical protein
MPARNGKTRRNDRRHDKLADALAPLVRDRDLGLVTQAEYEARLEDVRAALEPDQTLVESDLPGRTTRFALRSLRTGATLARFDFRAEP